MKNNNLASIYTTNSTDPIFINDQINLGSLPDCKIFINAPQVKGRHAKIYKRDNKYIIKDLHTETGTFVNNTQIIEAVLNHNDLIQISNFKFRFTRKPEKKNNSIYKSNNENWNKILQKIPEYALTNHPVLLIGETGTGKDIMAKHIHNYSNRSDKAFVTINCAALSPNLIESELFGHTKGSFTGATSDRRGAFLSASGGTLFLDEIGELPLELQPKLLRVLENKEVKMVGSDVNETIDVRIIAATHTNLHNKIKKNQFRTDLFYRLNTILLKIPNLNQRPEDILNILSSLSKNMPTTFTKEAKKAIQDRKWNGNIRELKNFVARASVLYSEKIITESDLYDLLEDGNLEPQVKSNFLNLSVVNQFERELIIEKLQKNYGNQCLTAKELNMPKSTLHDRIRKYQIHPFNFKP